MTFEEILDQAVAMLQRRGRLTYRTLRRQFDLDDEALEDLKAELLFSHPVVDEAGQGIVWTGETEATQDPPSTSAQPLKPEVTQESQPTQAESPPPEPSPSKGDHNADSYHGAIGSRRPGYLYLTRQSDRRTSADQIR
ncbi:MAG: hypothetical protein O7G88_22435 [bacterium]|nr:hypothetical protein [bacterium]